MSKNFEQLCTHLGIDEGGDALGNIQELMNFTLQSLGGIRILFHRLEEQRRKEMLLSLEDCSRWHGMGQQYGALKQVFHDSVERMLDAITCSEELPNIDPARHVIESFPNGSTLGRQSWMAAHWAILGNPRRHQYIDTKPKRASHLEAQSDHSSSDDRLVALSHLSKLLPEVFREVDKEGRSVHHIAARLDSAALFECVLSISQQHDGAKISDINYNGALPLHNTARFSRSLPLLKSVQNAYPSAIYATNKEGLLPLHWAAVKSQSVDIVKHLLSAFPDGVQQPNEEGYLPLHCAGQNDCLEVVQTIYAAYPAAVQTPDEDGGLPLHHACCFAKNVEVVRFLYSKHPAALMHAQSDGVTPLHLAASQNDSPDLLRFLLEVCPEAARMRDIEGWVALKVAAEGLRERLSQRRLDCFRVLLHASPLELAQGLDVTQETAVSRICLNAFPALQPELRRQLNWRARRSAVKLMLQFARIPAVEVITAPHLCDEETEEVWKVRAQVLCHLSQAFIEPQSLDIPAGVLRKIITYV